MHQAFSRRAGLAGLAAAAGALALSPRFAFAQAAAPAAASQAPGFYRFKVGSFTVTTVHDGFAARPVAGFVRNAPLEEVQKVLAESFLPTDTIRIPFTVTFVDTGRQLVIFDTGNGVTPAGATNGRMIGNMRSAGIDPARVNLVVMSHFHGDHIGGLIDAEGKRAFPNAEVVVPEVEWRWWTDTGNESRSPEGQRATFANTARRFAPYQGSIRQIADGAEVAPGIRAVAAHGHTPGHTCYLIADGDAQAMFVADATNRPELLARRPDFHIVFDFDPAMAEASRRRIYDRVATDRIRVTGYHFPFPANGYMAKEGNGYRFVPADWSSAL
ncbi:MBL fold metallo-hydrolase [Siccirubricoccus sp. G192]|uniref:MBL fold metallo-hydrolase n=1 Tax=Siccirubricoccus sp. G192 TaxID=2849651 RepID=UPI001C2CA53C|nr:MBL fold metallo-hydrolase [Siccirubricoccus sp. G192]MBV1799125.1 MBL fold metallo-hydrolase [Siccirubricoccus sp. G192]